MGESRKCDARCHNARATSCACWCRGLFHGKAGEPAREAFKAEWGTEIPKDGEPPIDRVAGAERWGKAIRRAATARMAAAASH